MDQVKILQSVADRGPSAGRLYIGETTGTEMNLDLRKTISGRYGSLQSITTGTRNGGPWQDIAFQRVATTEIRRTRTIKSSYESAGIRLSRTLEEIKHLDLIDRSSRYTKADRMDQSRR